MNNNFIFCLLIVSSLIFGCSKAHEHTEEKPIEINTFPKEISIPKALLQTVEADLANESKVLNPVYLFTPLKVAFTQKTHGTLSSEKVLYSLPKGGGTLDMQSIATGQGSFYLSFPEEQFKEKELPELEHLFFVSHSPITKIDGEDYGLGCGKWVDLKKSFASLQKPNFLQLNTTKNRHLLVMAGSYVFIFRKSNQIYLTQLTITDSKNSDLLCPQVAPDLPEMKL